MYIIQHNSARYFAAGVSCLDSCYSGQATAGPSSCAELAVLLGDRDGDGLDLCVGLQPVLTQLTPNTRHLNHKYHSYYIHEENQ